MERKEKAIHECLEAELRAVSSLTGETERSISEAADILTDRKGDIILIGVGKSGYVAMKTAATLTSLGHKTMYLHPVEALHGDLGVIEKGDVAIIISNSGKSPEVVKIAKYLREKLEINVICITADKKSPLAMHSDCVIGYELISEGCPLGLAPMASTTTTMVIGDMLASALTATSSFAKEDFAKFHPGGSLGLSLKPVSEVMVSMPAVPYVYRNIPFLEAIDVINTFGLGISAVVTEDLSLVGSLTDGDVRRALKNGISIDELLVEDCMHDSPKNVKAEQSLLEALNTMEHYKITSLFVTDTEKKLKGIVHMHNIVGEHIV